jgi:hypothetical protein
MSHGATNVPCSAGHRSSAVNSWLIAGIAALAALASTAACGGGGGGQEADVCSNADGALSDSAFVFVRSPGSGERVARGFAVTGCSSTFEATVNWRLLGRDGTELASGFTQGGSLGPGSFTFTVEYTVDRRQVGHLEVFEPRVTEQGFPPPRDVVPLVLQP